MDKHTQWLVDGVRASFERNGFSHYIAGWDDMEIGIIVVAKDCKSIGAAVYEVIQIARDSKR